MTRAVKRRLALLVAAIAILSGGTIAAVSATGQSTSGSSGAHARRGASPMLAAAAGYLAIPVSQLKSELQSGKTLAQIADATGGRTATGLIEALVAAKKARLDKAVAKLPQRVSAQVNKPLVSGSAATKTAAGKKATNHGVHAIARRYLGLSPAQLTSELHSGKSLAEVAAATPGKSAAGLIEAVVAARSERLATLVSSGKLSKADQTTRLANLSKRITALVNRTHVKKPG